MVWMKMKIIKKKYPTKVIILDNNEYSISKYVEEYGTAIFDGSKTMNSKKVKL